MIDDAPHDGEDLAPDVAGAMGIFIFESETSSDLRAFGGDLAGSQLPSQLVGLTVKRDPDRRPAPRPFQQVT